MARRDNHPETPRRKQRPYRPCPIPLHPLQLVGVDPCYLLTECLSDAPPEWLREHQQAEAATMKDL